MVDKDILILLLVAFLIKHFIADFPLQTKWMVINKGTLLHKGGLVHSGIHALASFVVLLFALPWLSVGLLGILLLVAAEAVIHYTIDFNKVKVDRHLRCSRFDTTCGEMRITAPGKFFLLIGVDQLLHGLSYAAMLYAVL